MIQVIVSAPLYVWCILVYILFIGIWAMHERVVYLPKLFIITIVLTLLKYKIFIYGNSTIVLTYLLFLILGCIGFFLCQKTQIKILKDSKSVELPKNYYTIFILSSFFGIKYILGYLQANELEITSRYLIFDTSISALFSGYFFGRAIACLYRF